MKIVINREKCVGHARCAAVAPALFALDAEGYIAVDGFEVPRGQEDLARKGARACPERVISVQED
jgi:ferredoxin